MHVAPLSNADEILTSLESVYGDMCEAAGINPTVDGEWEVTDFEELRGVTGTLTVDEDAHHLDSVDDFSKKKMHELMMGDPWMVGNIHFAKKDILHIRMEAVFC